MAQARSKWRIGIDNGIAGKGNVRTEYASPANCTTMRAIIGAAHS